MYEDEECYYEAQREQSEYEYQLSLEAEALAEVDAQLEEEESTMYDGIIKIKMLDYEDQVNNYLTLGWRLLGYVPVIPMTDLERKHGKHQKFIIGLPRVHPCGAISLGHTTPKEYDHETGKWCCPDCKKEEAALPDGLPF